MLPALASLLPAAPAVSDGKSSAGALLPLPAADAAAPAVAAFAGWLFVVLGGLPLPAWLLPLLTAGALADVPAIATLAEWAGVLACVALPSPDDAVVALPLLVDRGVELVVEAGGGCAPLSA